MSIKQQVKEYLTERNGTAVDIAAATGLTTRQVSQALNDLISGGGAFKVDMRGAKPVYSCEMPKRRKGLPMPYVPQFKEITPMDHDIWSHRNLAMLAR